jgi:hypothetical protein
VKAREISLTPDPSPAGRGALRKRLRLAGEGNTVSGRLLLLALLATSCIPPRHGKAVRPDRSWTRPEHLLPTEVNLVARVDWKRATALGAREHVFAYARALGFDQRLLDPLQGCLAEGETVWIGMRITREGFVGDALVIVQGPLDKAEIPCGAKGWRDAGNARETGLFEPAAPQTERRAPGLLARDPTGLVLTASTGQMDAVLRILRSGPDQDRLDPSSEPLVAVEARLGPDAIPDGLRGKSPPLADLARGLDHARLNVDIAPGSGAAAPSTVKVRVALTYDDAPRAKGAGELLAKLRAGLLNDTKPDWQAAAKSAHASVLDNVVKLSFEVPKDPSPPNPQSPIPNPSP